MPNLNTYALSAAQVTLSDGTALSEIKRTQGASLQDTKITLGSNNWRAIEIADLEQADTALDASRPFINDPIEDTSPQRDVDFEIVAEDAQGKAFTFLAYSRPDDQNIDGFAFASGVSGFPETDAALHVSSVREAPDYSSIEMASPLCFSAGARILTPRGAVPIEKLETGDLVLTMDNGPQAIRWIGQVRLPKAALKTQRELRPVRVAKDAFGPGCPGCDVWLSQQHRVLVSGWRAELYFGEPELLVPVRNLINDTTIRLDHKLDEIVYIHLLFDRHEVIYAESMASESFYLGSTSLAGTATRAEILKLFPELKERRDALLPARPLIRERELKTINF